MLRKVLLYCFLISGTLILLWLLLKQGSRQELEKLHEIERYTGKALEDFPSQSVNYLRLLIDRFFDSIHHGGSRLILQLVVIILMARIFSYLARRIGQPSVVGEITAGIVLGPSLLGFIWPELSSFLFPKESLPQLSVLSMMGLMLFMFIIGMEVDINILSRRAQDAVVISHSGITVQFFLGAMLAYFLYGNYAPTGISFVPFALFFGTAISITAFPVLARIIQERNLTRSYLGTLAITTAAVDDVTAWCLLALVIAIVKSGSPLNALLTISMAIAYIAFMFIVVRPFMNRIGSIFDTRENLTKPVVALIFSTLFLSAFITDMIGIHALVGAFLAGAIMPQHYQFKQVLIQKVEDVSVVLLLPLFFITTGLRTEIGLLNNQELWLVCLLIIGVTIAGKMSVVAVIARFLGLSWKNALSMGVLMNTKGLMELVILNIAYDFGVLTKELFTMFVLMALTTTFMTGPLLNLIHWVFRKKESKRLVSEDTHHKILISFGPAKMGKTLVGLAKYFSDDTAPSQVTALHVTTQSDVSPQEALIYERASFGPARKKAEEVNLPLQTHYKVTDDVTGEIEKIINQKKIDLLLVGAAKPLFGEKMLGGKLKTIIENARCDVAVLSDKNFSLLRHLLIIADALHEKYVLEYGCRLARNAQASLTIINANLQNQTDTYLEQLIHILQTQHNIPVTLLENRKPDEDFLKPFDLIVVSDKYWNNTLEYAKPEIRNNFSYLILHKHDPAKKQ